MQQELPQLPVVYMHVPQAAPVDGQLCMVEAQIHTFSKMLCSSSNNGNANGASMTTDLTCNHAPHLPANVVSIMIYCFAFVIFQLW